MNKYTLTFNDSNLERLYQQKQLKTLVYPIFLLMYMQGIVFMTCVITWRLTHGKYNNLDLNLSVLVWLLISLGVVYQKRHWAQGSLFILNHIFMSFVLTVSSEQDPHTVYIFSSCIMMGNCIILMISDFKWALINNLTLYLFRTGVSIMYYDMEFYYYLLIALASLIIMICLYQINYNTRAFYLSTLKDDQWKTILPKIIGGEFYLFQLNHDQVKFEVKLSNTLNAITSSEQFHQFVRQAKVETGETLEDYIYKRAKDKSLVTTPLQTNTKQLQVENQGKKQFISYSEFYLTEMNFLLVLECKKVNDIMVQNQEQHRNQMQHFDNFIRQTAKTLQKYLTNKDYLKVHRLQLVFFEFQARLRLSSLNFKIEMIEPIAVIEKCKKYFNNVEIIVKADNCQIKSVKPLFVLMLIHLLKSVSSKYVNIVVKRKVYTEIGFYGKLDKSLLNSDMIFQKALQLLVIEVEEKSKGYLFKLQSDFSYCSLLEWDA